MVLTSRTTMTISHYRMSALLMLVVPACYLSLHIIQQQHARSQDNISTILNRLQSRDDSDVAEARVELAAMGEQAIPPLLDLLRELVNQNPGVLSLMQADAQEHRTTIERSTKDLDDHTKSRVINDIYEILGQLHAAQAVPLLVSIMKKEEIDNMIEGMTPVMRALAEIGSDAVPALIQCLEEANTTLASARLRPPDLNDETRRRRLDWIEGRTQLRAILVLGNIGDKRAIPALEKVETSTENQFIREQAREAEQTIRRK
jgi:HEAT repeat protein